MVNWGIALGAGAKSALDTYERLDDMERRESADKRQERALKIKEDASSRASARFAQEQSDRERLRGILSGLEASPTVEMTAPAGEAGERTTRALGISAGEAPPTTEVAPSRGGSAPAPATGPVADTRSRGRGIDLGATRGELIRGNFLKEAAALTDIMNADAAREVTRLRAQIAKGELSDADRKRQQEFYARETEQLLALGSQLPQDDLADLTSDMAPLTKAITDAAGRAKSLLPDGIGMEFTHNDDGTVTAKTTDLDTGKVMGEKTFRKAGELKRYINMAAAIRDPITAAKWEANTAIAKRKAELENLDIRKKKGEALGSERRLRNEMAEDELLTAYREAIKDPGRNEEQMRFIGNQLAILNSEKWTDTIEEEDPDTGKKTKRLVNKLDLFTDRVVPLQTVERTNSKGEVVQYPTERAVKEYITALPDLLQQAGGDPNRVLAILKNEHDKVNGFRPGAFDRYVRPIITPQLDALVRQAQAQAQAQATGAQPGGGAGRPQTTRADNDRPNLFGTGLGHASLPVAMGATTLETVRTLAFGDRSEGRDNSKREADERPRKFSPRLAADRARRERLGLSVDGR